MLREIEARSFRNLEPLELRVEARPAPPARAQRRGQDQPARSHLPAGHHPQLPHQPAGRGDPARRCRLFPAPRNRRRRRARAGAAGRPSGGGARTASRPSSATTSPPCRWWPGPAPSSRSCWALRRAAAGCSTAACWAAGRPPSPPSPATARRSTRNAACSSRIVSRRPSSSRGTSCWPPSAPSWRASGRPSWSELAAGARRGRRATASWACRRSRWPIGLRRPSRCPGREALLAALRRPPPAARRPSASRCVGPQRDELEIRFGGKPIRQVASAGERKALSLLLTLAQGRVLEQQGRRPLYLLDDLDAELDRERRRKLWRLLAPGRRDAAPGLRQLQSAGDLAGRRARLPVGLRRRPDRARKSLLST